MGEPLLASIPGAQMPGHMTSDPQCAHEEMEANISRQRPRSRREEPCDPRPTESCQWTIATPSYSPVLGNRQRWMSAAGDTTHICSFAILPAVPPAEGEREVRDTGPRLSRQPFSDIACWLLCCSHSVCSHGGGARRKRNGRPGGDKSDELSRASVMCQAQCWAHTNTITFFLTQRSGHTD